MTTKTFRNNRLDGLNFFLVCMVVVGHCIHPYFLLGYAILQGVLHNSYNREWSLFVLPSLSVIVIMLMSGYACIRRNFKV